MANTTQNNEISLQRNLFRMVRVAYTLDIHETCKSG